MLVRLDQLPGIERSFANRSGTLLRLSVSAAGDVANVVDAASELLDAEYGGSTQLSGAAFATALKGEEWRDHSRIGELSSIEMRILVGRGLLALLVIGSIVLTIVWLRRRAVHTSGSGYTARR